MAEYIDKWQAVANLMDAGLRDTAAAVDAIQFMTAADVCPVVKAIWKHVQWVVDEEWQEGGYWISRCSNCSMPYHTETPFCPHCGADMREEK